MSIITRFLSIYLSTAAKRKRNEERCAEKMAMVNGHGYGQGNGIRTEEENGLGGNNNKSSFAVKAGLAQMLKGGVIMDVVNAEQVL